MNSRRLLTFLGTLFIAGVITAALALAVLMAAMEGVR